MYCGLVLGGEKRFSSSPNVHAISWAYPASCSVEARDSFPEDKVGLECEANHSPLSSAEVKNEWRYSMIKRLVKHMPGDCTVISSSWHI